MSRRETNPASNLFLRCSPPSGTHRDSQSWIEERWGRQRPPGGEKGEFRGGESGQASNLTLRSNWVLKIGFLNVQN